MCQCGVNGLYGVIRPQCCCQRRARVSNELGAGNPEKAKRAMTVALKLSGFVAFVLGLALAIGHNFIQWQPRNSKRIYIHDTFRCGSVIVEPLEGVVLGVVSLTGCGWQKLACRVNLATYLAGVAISGLLGFKTKLHAK
ncbi:protein DETOXIFICATION 19-like [Prunus yedoensis var. nudiflora]|uniref:Protein DETOXIFICATION 19-like n=1 Tax=Prunus yedoensis var. nudiflora TaxID=2094558 RepID=A0A314XUD3_PRUYE|nr:protein DETOXIFICATION 19-like [Prunus yedoensis var. nudiflora]